MRDLVVVGGGIIGATVAEAFRQKNLDVVLLDDNRPNSGSRPSGGHLNPSWFGKVPVEESKAAMDLLENTWGLIEQEFVFNPGKDNEKCSKIWRVNVDSVMQSCREECTVQEIKFLHNYPLVIHSKGEERCKLLLVATGAWAGELLDVKVQSKAGVSFRLRGSIPRPVVVPWAPYKQVVVHQQYKNILWVGDGSAIIPSNWTPTKTRDCLHRCVQITGQLETLTTMYGIRSYTVPHTKSEEHPCLFRQLGPRAYLATGPGKLGTLSAGWVARRLLDATSH